MIIAKNKRHSDLTGPPRSRNYRNSRGPYGTSTAWQPAVTKAPPFRLWYVDPMLLDSRIRFGLWMLKGPIISNARFMVYCDDEAVRQWIIAQIQTFWLTSAAKALRAIEYGYSGSESLYEVKSDGLIHFTSLKPLHPFHVRPVLHDGAKVGMRVEGESNVAGTYLGGPKSFWHVHGREINPWWGVSRLLGSYGAWYELNAGQGCARDVVRLFFYKYALAALAIKYPLEVIPLPDGTEVAANELADQIAVNLMSGGTVTLPNMTDENGNSLFDIVYHQSPSSSTEVLQYVETLKRDELEGMGVPPELVHAEGTGAYAGRRVPAEAFYTMLQDMANWLIFDFCQQIIDPVMWRNWGQTFDYDVIPVPIGKSIEAAEGEDEEGAVENDGSDDNETGDESEPVDEAS